MPDYLLDCNHLSEAIRKVSVVRDAILTHRKAGHRYHLRLLTSDRDFEALPDIAAENWIRA